jgi:hypothetical protein
VGFEPCWAPLPGCWAGLLLRIFPCSGWEATYLFFRWWMGNDTYTRCVATRSERAGPGCLIIHIETWVSLCGNRPYIPRQQHRYIQIRKQATLLAWILLYIDKPYYCLPRCERTPYLINVAGMLSTETRRESTCYVDVFENSQLCTDSVQLRDATSQSVRGSFWAMQACNVRTYILP